MKRFRAGSGGGTGFDVNSDETGERIPDPANNLSKFGEMENLTLIQENCEWSGIAQNAPDWLTSN